MSRLRPDRTDAGIFLISFAVLLVELLLTRIFSVTMFYHLSFLVVSLAMLGFGASGLVVGRLESSGGSRRLAARLATAGVLFAVSTVVAVYVAFNLPVSLSVTTANWVAVGVIYVLCVVPFLAGGTVVALLLTYHADRANRLYFFDLMGAALGCLVFIPATNALGAPTAILLGAAVGAFAAAVLAGAEAPRARVVAAVTAALLIAAVVANLSLGFFDLRYAKGRTREAVLASKWNSFSRVEVLGTEKDLTEPVTPNSAGFSTMLDPGYKVRELFLLYDADAATQITGFDGKPEALTHLYYDVTSTPYHVRRFNNVLVIGAGGGRDILTALHLGSGPVTGLEINPLTVGLMRGRFRDFTGGLYAGYPGVTVVNDEGRSFVRRSRESYDLIQASLVDTWAASAAGAYALTENSLYTVEAFEEYLDHLTPDGMIAFSRWYLNPPVEPLRVVSLATEALRRRGVADASGHIYVVRTDPQEGVALATILIRRTPFTAEELGRLHDWAGFMRFVEVYSPDDAARGYKPESFHRLLGPDGHAFVSTFPYEISTVTDDRPFFFDRVPLAAWIGNRLGLTDVPAGRGELTLGGQTLLIALVVTSVCTLLLFLLPLVTGRWGERKDAGEALSASRAALWAAYFSCLGLGFIVVEIVLIQRFNLFLGYPVYSLSVVLFTILLGSSLGSLVAGRWSGAALPKVLAAICASLALYAVALPWLLSLALDASTPVRIVVAAVAVAPIGFLMGMPFPTGLRRAGRESSRLIPWAWAVNGGASVFGSTLAMVISMTLGFAASFAVGGTAYLVALVLAAWLTRAESDAPAVAMSVAAESTGD